MLDLKIINGNVADLEKGEFCRHDIGVSQGKIRILKGGEAMSEAVHTIDAKGKIVSPGFIDIHMHEEDLTLTKGEYFDISQSELAMGVTTCVGGNCGSNRNDVSVFKNWVEENGYPVNYLTYIGNNSLRQIAGADDLYKAADRMQIQKMKEMLQKGIEQGAIGLSYGLEYCPGLDENEIIGIAEEIKGREDLLISVHARYDAKKAMEAIDEIRHIAEETKVPLQISHLSSLCAFGNMSQGLEKIEKMISDGLNVKADTYPYGAFSCKIGSTVFDEGCFDNWGKSYDSIILAEEPYKGKVCDRKTFESVRKEYPMMYVIAEVMNENEVRQAISQPYVMAGSDGGFNCRQGHPRGAGTFPRFLGQYVKKDKVMPLIDMIAKMTSMPAERLKLAHRKGMIKDGYDADIVIFDNNMIKDNATFAEPKRAPSGIETVIINGQVAMDRGITVNDKAGKYICRQHR